MSCALVIYLIIMPCMFGHIIDNHVMCVGRIIDNYVMCVGHILDNYAMYVWSNN